MVTTTALYFKLFSQVTGKKYLNYIRIGNPGTGIAALHARDELRRLRKYDLRTGYPQYTEDRQIPGSPRTLLVLADVVAFNLANIMRTLCHKFPTPHFLELLVKVVVSVALDYAFENRTSRNTRRATSWDEFAW